MPRQLDLFEWADSRPSNVIDAMPALCRKAAMEVIYSIPNRKGDGRVIVLERKSA
jgi:hypothetical protein